MEKITYILGAGFSAPLGLPVTNNFLIKSKDLFFTNTEKYSYFKEVFEEIERLSVCKNYFDTDLFNIEEILSILEMRSFLEGNKLNSNFVKYIQEVILHYSSKLEMNTNRVGNWYDFLFGGRDSMENRYGYFVANLLGGRFLAKDIDSHGHKIKEYFFERFKNIDKEYSIITLNYDLVLEKIAQFINDNYVCEEKIEFNRGLIEDNLHMPYLAKLHGSADWDLIIPPTWAKGLEKNIAQIWSFAKAVIEKANHIRFIGYSLPKTDTYVQYLLKSAIIKSTHLKSIDVICLDTDGTVKKRFDEMINFKYYRFANANVIEYLNNLKEKTKYDDQRLSMYMYNLEKTHNEFMNNHSKV